jgi:flagellar protein FlaG
MFPMAGHHSGWAAGVKGGMSKWRGMNPHVSQPTKVTLANSNDYRENYANSVQVRVNLWDFFLMFGTVNQTAPDAVTIQNFQGVYLSPQQAKALSNLLNQNITQYESAFGEIRLEPQQPGGAVQ